MNKLARARIRTGLGENNIGPGVPKAPRFLEGVCRKESCPPPPLFFKFALIYSLAAKRRRTRNPPYEAKNDVFGSKKGGAVISDISTV